jgi:hypothetical protein
MFRVHIISVIVAPLHSLCTLYPMVSVAYFLIFWSQEWDLWKKLYTHLLCPSLLLVTNRTISNRQYDINSKNIKKYFFNLKNFEFLHSDFSINKFIAVVALIRMWISIKILFDAYHSEIFYLKAKKKMWFSFFMWSSLFVFCHNWEWVLIITKLSNYIGLC